MVKYVISFFIIIFVPFILIFSIIKNPGPDLFSSPAKNILLSSDPERLKKYVELILDTEKPRNYFNLESLNIVAGRIENIFKTNCDEVAIHPFKIQNLEYKNIRCTFNPKMGKRIIIGAHYDVFRSGPGADDNASGVAGILELSRLIKQKRPNIKNRIDLVAFTLEEPPFFKTEQMGSYIFAKELFDKKEKIEFMLSLEMIGYYTEAPNSQTFVIPWLGSMYGSKGNFVALVGNLSSYSLTRRLRSIFNKNSNIRIHSFNAPSFIMGVDWSDHLNFWKFDFPAFMITDTSFFRYEHYHRKTDTPEKLDYQSMAKLIHAIYFGISNY